MNFSQVKSTSIPEGAVKSISIGDDSVWSAQKEKWSIDDYEVNENLIIISATPASSSILLNKLFIISLKPETAFDSTDYTALIYDETTESLCKVERKAMATAKTSLSIRFYAREPRADHTYTFWLVDPDGKVSANSMSLTLTVR